jgi:fumarate reductase subunit C
MATLGTETASPRKPYVRPISKTTWFLSNARYKAYMVHEISSIFVALYMVQLIFGLFALASGEAAWEGYLSFLQSPLVILLTLIGLVFFIIHTTSWFKAVPQATRIMRGEDVVPGKILVTAHYAIWAAVSLFVIILAAVA